MASKLWSSVAKPSLGVKEKKINYRYDNFKKYQFCKRRLRKFKTYQNNKKKKISILYFHRTQHQITLDPLSQDEIVSGMSTRSQLVGVCFFFYYLFIFFIFISDFSVSFTYCIFYILFYSFSVFFFFIFILILLFLSLRLALQCLAN